MKKTTVVPRCLSLSLSAPLLLCLAAPSGAQDYPTNRGDLVGPTFRTDANIAGFKVHSTVGGAVTKDGQEKTFCAPRNSSMVVTKRDKDVTFVKFTGLGKSYSEKDITYETSTTGAMLEKKEIEHKAYELVCVNEANDVLFDVVYKIPNTDFDAIPLRASGIAYGALVVPFKFRLGSDKKISSSATIAPYVGARWHRLQKWGVELMPIATAGVGLVPVNDPVTNDSSTKAAFSTAVGVTLNSTTQKNFSAGILFGKDFLGKRDRELDPSTIRPWISIWVGTAQ